MKYDLSQPLEQDKAFHYLTRLASGGSMVEVKKIVKSRSLSQNSYLHLALGLFGLETGYTIEEAKTIYKRDINPDIYVYQKSGAYFLRSSADLDTAEMTKSIDRLRAFAAEHEIDIPAPAQEAELRSLYNTLEANYQRLQWRIINETK